VSPKPAHPVLKGAKALVIGIANDSSIAYGCARAFRELEADLALTCLNEKAQIGRASCRERVSNEV
jgi:enoyl-[acyl-carrier protein] reductase I